PSPRKVEALAKTPPPGNVKQVRQFLGLAGYFRRYIKDFATKTRCIAYLTRKGVSFHWRDEQEKVRQDLIRHLTSEPILAIFDHKLPTEVHTDASSIGYGAVLLQTQRDGKKHVVTYFSKVTQGAESKYHSYELETLAVVKALQSFRHYLVGLKFVVVTDCNALKSTERKKDLVPRVARWWIYLQDFDFTIEYRKGIMMPHVDYLSRNPPLLVNQVIRPRNWAQIAQAADGETQNLLEKLQQGSLDSSRYVAKHDLLYYRYKPVGEEPRLLCYVPKGHRLSLLRVFHDEHEHVGVDKTVDLILKHFWFPSLRQFVSKYVAHCLICISKKRVPRSPQQYITSWEKPDVPFNTVHVDALGPLPPSNGFKFVLLIVDAFTKYCLLYPMRRQDVVELKRIITQAVSLFGVPTLMVTDKGRMFESNEFVTWTNDLGCDLHHITPEMHQANGQVERYVRTVLNMIRIEVNHKGSTWSEVLWKLQLVLNITKQKSTRNSPLNLLIGTEATTPVIRGLIRDLATENARPNREALREITRHRTRQLLRENQGRQDEYANRHRHPPRQYAVGDFVFVIKFSQSTGKLDPGMRGPYRVVGALPSGRYELKLLSGSYGKTTQAAAQYMVPWRGEWCPETCAAFFG
ncbi:jg1094, partial [Pararge aegeria aegeria]